MKKSKRWQAMARQEKEAMELWGTAMAIMTVLVAGFAVVWGWVR